MTEKIFKVKEDINNPAEEAFRVLRTNIEFSSLHNKIKCLAVVSPSHSDGKTTTTINLAITMSTPDVRVLLIDADLRKPIVYKHFAGAQVMGLSDVIAGKIDFQDAICKTDKDNFFILSSGNKPPFPTEFLSSHAFDQVLARAKQEFDFVIVDTPAMRSYIDGAVIASKADGVVIIVKHEITYSRSVIRVKKQLEKANANILGIILNKVSKSIFKDYYITSHSYNNLKKSFDE